MKKLKATKTAVYADRTPSVPHYKLVSGEEYNLPDDVAVRVVDLDGGKIVSSKKPKKADAKLPSGGDT